MADADAVATGGKKAGDFLTQKVGPLPLWTWAIAGAAIYLWFRNQQQASASASASAVPNQQTDPAGNIGTIDPATGYVYGTPEDLAALAANNAGSGGGSAGATSTSGGQAYADNNSWGIAAVNYLVGLGIDATTANQAIALYLSSQPLTTAQQGDVNLAIQALGPPPQLPGPTTNNPPPVTNPPPGGGGGSGTVTVPKVEGLSIDAAESSLKTAGLVPKLNTATKGGTSYVIVSQTPGAGTKVAKGSTVDLAAGVSGIATLGPKPPTSGGKGGGQFGTKKSVPAPTGLTITAKRSTSASLKWNRVNGATGYQVAATDMASKKAVNQAVPASVTTATVGGLQPSHSYVFDVWAEPTPTGQSGTGPHAEISATLPRTG
jgi:hypothetical protein